MITLQVITLLVLPLLISTSYKTESFQYAFYRDIKAPKLEGTRRIFGGEPVQLSEFPAVCALIDHYKIVRCTGAILSKFWVITAAHCVTTKVAFIKFNSRWTSDVRSKTSPIMYMYRHPDYRVVEEDEGRGIDVTLLHHDIGMVRSQYAMTLQNQPSVDPIVSIKRFNPIDLKMEQVMILGFGRKDQESVPDFKGEELFGVILQLTFCERGAWFHCICGISDSVGRSQGGRGVCSGDSGGPVLYRGLQIAVTSMGPTQCRKLFSSSLQGSTSVFTTLYQYANLINSTIIETENLLRQRKPRTLADPAHGKCTSLVLHYGLFRLIACFVFSVVELNVCKLLL